MTSPPTLTPAPPTHEQIEQTRQAAFDLLRAAQAAYDAALQEHEEFRRTQWLPTPRRRRTPLTAIKDHLATQVTETRAARDALLTSPLALSTLTASQREAACHLTREGRRYIERAHDVPPQHPGYAPSTAAPTNPATNPAATTTPEGIAE